MSKQAQQEPTFTEESVSYGQPTSHGEPIPVVEDTKYRGEGMDTITAEQADSDAQLGKFLSL